MPSPNVSENDASIAPCIQNNNYMYIDFENTYGNAYGLQQHLAGDYILFVPKVCDKNITKNKQNQSTTIGDYLRDHSFNAVVQTADIRNRSINC